MKKILASVLALFNLSSQLVFAEERTAEALLHQMNETSQHLSYEISYILIKKNSVEPTILLLNSDVKELSRFYNFTQVGSAREAGVACQVLRVASKEGLRHSYILWVNEKSKLLLRADLVDRDSEVLEQYRTISYSVNDNTSEILGALNTAKLPGVLFLPKGVLEDSWLDSQWF